MTLSPASEGSWERNGRSMSAAAVLGLLLVGVVYFHAQILLVVAAMGLQHLHSGSQPAPANFDDKFYLAMRNQVGAVRLALVVSQYCFMLLPTWWLVKRWHTSNVGQYVRLCKSSVPEVALAIITTVAILPACNYLANEFTQRLRLPENLTRFMVEIFTAHSFSEFLLLVFVVAVTPAICEEFFFRGYVQRTLERTIHGKSAWLVGVFFGLFHLQPLGLISLVLLGVIFGYFFYRSRSLLPSIVAHFTNNFIAIWLMYRAPRLGEVDLGATEQIPLSWVLVSLPIVAACLVLYHRLTAGNFSTRARV
ncbi:MAG: CPBP family glutamic-type intramembrane protease [bacterium]